MLCSDSRMLLKVLITAAVLLYAIAMGFSATIVTGMMALAI